MPRLPSRKRYKNPREFRENFETPYAINLLQKLAALPARPVSGASLASIGLGWTRQST